MFYLSFVDVLPFIRNRIWTVGLYARSFRLAAARVALNLLSREGKRFSSLGGGWLGLHSCLDLTGHGQESLFDVGRSLGRRFEEFHAERVSEFFALFRGNNTLARQIGLVTDKKLIDVFRRVSLDLMQPRLHIVERFLIGDIIGNDNSMGTAVVRCCNGAESFLSGCVPDLKLNSLSIEFDRTNFEIDTDGRNVGFGVSVVGESKKQTRLTDTRVSNEE